MEKRFAVLFVVCLCFVVCSARGDYSVSEQGTWPQSWPKELEPLRKQSQTYEGPIDQLRYLIPFAKREEFEAAWPHLLKVKTKGAPIILMRGPRTDFFALKPAGVIFQSPPARIEKDPKAEIPVAGKMDVRSKWRNATFLELIVDGEIVDLNRVQLPADTPIVDERFADDKK